MIQLPVTKINDAQGQRMLFCQLYNTAMLIQ